MNRSNVEPVINAAVSALVNAGADAVVMTGSHARGQAGPLSDIDLHAIGDGPPYRLEHRDGWLISTSYHSVDEVQASFMSPASVGAAVPGWQRAKILHDPYDIAENLVQQARSWSWEDIGDDILDAWVAEELTGLAEEVFKLVQLLDRDMRSAAAVQRDVLALRVPIVMATHLRLLYDSENVLWDLVSDNLGYPWADVQPQALGINDEPFQESCEAALQLYAMACARVTPTLDVRQSQVTEAAGRALKSVIRRS